MKKIFFFLIFALFISCTSATKKVISTPKVEQPTAPKVEQPTASKVELPTKPMPHEMIHSTIANQTAIIGSNWKTYYIIPNPSKLKTTSQSFSGSKFCYTDHHKNGINVITTITKKPTIDSITIKTSTEAGATNLFFILSIEKTKGTSQYASNANELKAALQKYKENKSPTSHTIFLNTGNYGDFEISDQSNITLIPAFGRNPKFESFSILRSNNINILSLDIQSEKQAGKEAFYVKIDKKSANITISNCKIQAAEETEKWAPEDWQSKAANGIFSEGENCIFKNNLIQHIHHGIETKGDNCVVANNIIIRFAGDAIRNTGDNNLFDSNYLADALVDDYAEKGGNHDDLFQSWTFDKPISNLIIRNNIAINCTDTTNHLQSKNVQGIACFDGFEENWLVENNLVVIEHPHGIALFGANNCKIINNRIIYNPFNKYQFESLPWIMIHNHKDGRKSHNNLITNNITSVIEVKDKASTTISKNTITNKPFSKYFHDYQNWIFDKK